MPTHQLLSKIVDEFLTKHPRSTWATGEPKLALPELKEYLTKYQDPQQADSILKIQKELDETKIVLHKTIQSVLERGEKIDDLVAKSDGLSSQSKMFYRGSAGEFTGGLRLTHPKNRQRSKTRAASSCKAGLLVTPLSSSSLVISRLALDVWTRFSINTRSGHAR
ncbi:hypothetical protein COL154_002196 [Colletotrichum chrysophilum]|nr:hypothetical protein COL154_002196 [Colletotrichum chrysophilum]